MHRLAQDTLRIVALLALMRSATSLSAYEVTPPPARLRLDPFYEKHVDVGGYPIVSSGRVNDFALLEAAFLVDAMLAERPGVRAAMAENGSRLIVMAHDEMTTDVPEHSALRPRDWWDARARGLGGTWRDPVCSVGEENLLAYEGDPYSAESILIHELAHNIHLVGMATVDPSFDKRLEACYERAMEAGKWRGFYAATNHHEYFAEGVQSWFGNNRPPDHDHNHVDTRAELIEYDAGLAEMCREVFRDTDLVYTKPTTRLTGHLAGYDPSQAPRFRWPERLAAVKRQIREQAERRSRGEEFEPTRTRRAPDILLILADDLGWMDLAFQGGEHLETPHLDRLAREGMRFTDAYAASPVCTPTRASILTGLSPARLRITNHAPGHPEFLPDGSNLRGAEWQSHLGLEHVTLAEHLRRGGYTTGFIGKWHLSHRPGDDADGSFEPRLRPEHQGFGSNVGGYRAGGPSTYFAPWRIPGLEHREEGEYLPDRLAEEAVDFIEAQRARPFFLCWWMYSVHYPIEAPEDLIAKHRKRGQHPRPEYAAMIEGMDRAIGRVLATIDSRRSPAETLVLFTSDNGSLFSNEPLRAKKGYLYEGGIRVPWIVRWPGVVDAGSICETPIVTTDIFPTLLEAAGIDLAKPGALDGESIVPLLEQSGALRRNALFFHYPNYAFHGRNRLGSAIREGDHKLIRWYDDDSVELYDLSKDLSEAQNLADAEPERAARLEKRLAAWLQVTRAKLPIRLEKQAAR